MLTEVLPKALHQAEAFEVRAGQALRAASTWFQEAGCAVTGHDYLVRAEGNPLFLRCADCGHQTPGWHIDVKRRSGDDCEHRGNSPKRL
jgi:NAD-dependent SIR2 family protein deacetylase